MEEKSMDREAGEVNCGKDVDTRLYRRRWIIIFAFAFYLSSNSYQWLHLSIIGDVLLTYYNDSLPEDEFRKNTAIDWLSLVYMLTFVLLIVPAMWLLEKKGLRISALSGSFLNAVGSWIKVAAVDHDRFWVLMFGQTVCAVAQVFTLSLPTRIAALWFGPNEVSTATAIGVFGIQVGVATGFVVPPILVPANNDAGETGFNLQRLFYIGAGITTLSFVILLIVFKDEPPLPPSRAQVKASTVAKKKTRYGKTLLSLARNRDFCLLCFTFAINLGCSYAISTLLNPIILHYFEGHQKDAGAIGLTLILSGVGGSVVSGIWLDRTKTFKGTTIGIYLISFIGMTVYTFTLRLHKIWVAYLCSGFLGFFLTGYRPVGFQFAAEISFPESEGVSSGLLNAATEIIGICSTIGMRAMMTSVSIFAANVTVCVALIMGTALSAFIKPDYKRQKAGLEIIAQTELSLEVGEDELPK